MLDPIEVGYLYHYSDAELQSKLNDMFRRGYEPIAFLGLDSDGCRSKWVFKVRATATPDRDRPGDVTSNSPASDATAGDPPGPG